MGGPDGVVADELASLLNPETIAARVDPGCPDTRVVIIPADHRRVAVGGQRNGGALLGASGTVDRVIAGQLAALLGPNSIAAVEDPRGPDAVAKTKWIIARPANDGGVTVGGQCDRIALCNAITIATSNRACADQLAALLGPNSMAAGEDPSGSCPPVVAWPAHD